MVRQRKDGGTPGDFLVTQVGPDANLSVAPFDAWGFAVNYTTAPVGGCQIALVPGSEVLWAYNYFNLSHLLLLSGPGAASADAVHVHVDDAQSGSPLAEATIGEDVGGATTPIAGAVTNAAGNADRDARARRGCRAQGRTREGLGALERGCGVRPQRQRRYVRHHARHRSPVGARWRSVGVAHDNADGRGARPALDPGYRQRPPLQPPSRPAAAARQRRVRNRGHAARGPDPSRTSRRPALLRVQR